MPQNVPHGANEEHLGGCSGAQIIDKLRLEAQTGHPTIEEVAHQLGRAAETSWLRQLSMWILYGRLPSFGASDFFVRRDKEDSDELLFRVSHSFLPKFVTRHTASSILFVGKSLNQIRSVSNSTSVTNKPPIVSELDLLPSHVELLSVVRAPVVAAELGEAITKIRLSLSRNLLQHLLPREKIAETLTVLYQFFLLGRGEFAMALVAEADEKMSARYRGSTSTKSKNSVKGVILKETDISQTLARSLTVLSTLSSHDEHTDDVLETAGQVLHLTPNESHSNRPGTPGRAKDAESVLPQISDLSFNELLLSVPCSLSMDVPFPLDLFITKGDMDVYSSINAYLLAIRRAHLHLAQLWRHSSIRRDHPCPPGYQYSNSAYGKKVLERRRRRTAERTKAMRKVWATCAAAVFFLAESEAYFQGAIVQESFEHFLSWVNGAHSSPSGEQSHTGTNEDTANSSIATDTWQQHDPEALGLAHRRFLSSVGYSLLLTDPTFAKLLRVFCTHVDDLVAYITRLTGIQQSLDLEEDEGVEDFAQNYKREEGEVLMELDRARRRLDSDLKGLVERLRDVDSERIGASAPGVMGLAQPDAIEYEPLRVGGIDRLLMKLDWSSEYDEKTVSKDLL